MTITPHQRAQAAKRATTDRVNCVLCLSRERSVGAAKRGCAAARVSRTARLYEPAVNKTVSRYSRVNIARKRQIGAFAKEISKLFFACESRCGDARAINVRGRCSRRRYHCA